MLDQELARKLIQGKPWHHAFEIIPGVRTDGSYDPENMWNDLQLPDDLSGMTLADVGASNGYFSFEARKRGARVEAFDFRHKDNSGFGLAQYINGMDDITHHQVNVLDISQEQYGQFDIVLALGLFYHISDPYRALANCAALSRDQLLIESYCVDTLLPKDLAAAPVMRFIPDCKRVHEEAYSHNDRSNFWGFTSTCLQRMVEDVGFSVRRVDVRGDRVFLNARRAMSADAASRLKIAYGSVDRIPRGENPDDPDAWTIF